MALTWECHSLVIVVRVFVCVLWTWCVGGLLWAGLVYDLNPRVGEYLTDIVDAFEMGVVFDTGTVGFATECYEADWFESMNGEVSSAGGQSGEDCAGCMTADCLRNAYRHPHTSTSPTRHTSPTHVVESVTVHGLAVAVRCALLRLARACLPPTAGRDLCDSTTTMMRPQGWSTCGQNYYMNGVLIGEDNTYLYFLEGANCCRIGVAVLQQEASPQQGSAQLSWLQ